MPEYHLIIAEGSKTEPNYFNGLKNEINKKYANRISLEIYGIGQGSNTTDLFEIAQEKVKQNVLKYKHVWIVYDKDDFSDEKFDKVITLCKTASSDIIEYHAIWSNECIEIWFLLHFCYIDSKLGRNEYIKKLSNLLEEKYEKNDPNIYKKLRPFLDCAIRNAGKLKQQYLPSEKPSKCNPCTTVHEIFLKLKPYMD